MTPYSHLFVVGFFLGGCVGLFCFFWCFFLGGGEFWVFGGVFLLFLWFMCLLLFFWGRELCVSECFFVFRSKYVYKI